MQFSVKLVTALDEFFAKLSILLWHISKFIYMTSSHNLYTFVQVVSGAVTPKCSQKGVLIKDLSNSHESAELR